MHDTDVSFGSHDGTALHGVLRRRAGDPPGPCVLLLGGGAPLDHDGEVDPALALAHVAGVRVGLLRQLADALADAGIASFRYDKRGVGRSGGDFSRRSAHEVIDDAEAAVRHLQGRADVTAVIVLGHSEGGMIAPQLLRRGCALAGIATAGTTASGLLPMIDHQFSRAALRAELAGADPAAAWDQLRQLRADVAAGLERVDYGPDGQESGRWIRTWDELDLQAAAAAISCPLLVLHGDRDYQVPWTEAVRLVELARSAGNEQVTLALFAHVDHLLRFESGHSSPQRYHAEPDRPLEPLIARTIVAWVQQVLAGPSPAAAADVLQGFAHGLDLGVLAAVDPAALTPVPPLSAVR